MATPYGSHSIDEEDAAAVLAGLHGGAIAAGIGHGDELIRRGSSRQPDKARAGCLSLPCFPGLTEREQLEVADAVRELV